MTNSVGPPVADPHFPAGDLLVRAGWQRLSDRILAGSCHDLNGRSSALYGLSELARAGDDPEFLADALASEARRIQGLGTALRALSSRSPDRSRPLSVADHLDDLASLFALQPGAERFRVEVVSDPATPAVEAPWRTLGRAILLAMNVVAAHVLAGGTGGGLRLVLAPAGGHPQLRIEGAAVGNPKSLDPGTAELRDQFGVWPDELASAIRALGGEARFQEGGVERPGAGPHVEIRLPKP